MTNIWVVLVHRKPKITLKKLIKLFEMTDHSVCMNVNMVNINEEIIEKILHDK